MPGADAGAPVVAGPEVGAVLTDLAIDDAWLVDPASGRSGRGSLRVEDGMITELEWVAASDPRAEPAIVVAPGFIDLHAHLREPGGEEAETYATGLAAAAHGGFTSTVAGARNSDAAPSTTGLPS